jgi:hypothetical protein
VSFASSEVREEVETAGFSTCVGMGRALRCVWWRDSMLVCDVVWFASYEGRNDYYSLSGLRRYECSM